MDDTRCREFFSQPINLYQRRYEALRAVFVAGRSQKEVAELFGFEHGSLRQLVCEFREHCRDVTEASPFFANAQLGGQP
jgi:DNA-directed RNA polymerase specialized sigma24 family protein